jgi:hypothetical protein
MQKEKEKEFDSYYLEIRTVKNPKKFTMAFIQCEILHLMDETLIFLNIFLKYF